MTEGVGGEGEEQSPRSSGVRSRRLLRCKRGWSASRCCLPPRRVTATPLGGRGDDYDNDVRWEEQDMPYLSGDRRRAERGEGNVDEGVDDEHVDGRVRSPRLADTVNGRRWRLRRDGNRDNDVEEGGSQPTTPQTTAMRELVERLRSACQDWQRAEEGEGDVDDGGDN